MTDVRLFGTLEKVSKQDDGSLLIDFVATTESVDDQNEIMDYEAAKAASADYMKWANVREMHQPSAVGTTLTLQTDDVLKRITGTAHVVDPLAVTKVETGVYKGVSMGGSKLATEMQKVGGKMVRRITAIKWKELSLVDRPSNDDSALTIAKMADAESEEEPNVTKEQIPADGTDVEQPAAEQPSPEAEAAATEPNAEAASEEAGKASAPDSLKKSASDDIVSADMVVEMLARLIEHEQGEGDADQVGPLQQALKLVQQFAGSEAAELTEPDNVEEAAELEAAAEAAPAIVMAYSAVIGDLAKRAADLRKAGARNSANDQQKLDQIHDLAVAAGAYPNDHTAGEDTAEPADKADKGIVAGDLAKAVAAEFAQSAPFAKAADVAAIEERLLGVLEPMQEQLSKIAAQPMPGGPLPSYAPAPHWAAGNSPDVTARVSEELTKLADAASDPMVADTLRKQAAAAEIRATWRSQS